ncbi:MAG: hypothetical protein A3F09_02155 [Chlamydiae bacterium RIFCSPHIGHO2_12_FULL_49_11]|nr:MAG: hypothetical protein A3F09_02155 [Chlamydiae bacterium RIFCSPHIGHO2_12_FULL_49_11]
MSSNILLSAYQSSDFFGKCIFIALFFLSILTWYIFVQKLVQLRTLEGHKRRFVQTVRDLGNILSGETVSGGMSFSTVYHNIRTKAVRLLEKNHYFQPSENGNATFLVKDDIDMLNDSTLSLIENEVKILQKELVVLSTIVTLAPFLGILGTVWGILISLTSLGEAGSLIGNQNVLSGLTTALATTVLGLVIAIPALIFHNIAKVRIHNFAASLSDFGFEMIETIEIQFRRVL